MTSAQQQAIRRLASEPGGQLHASTARILRERYRYIEPYGDGWRLTDHGRAYLAAELARANYHAVEDQLKPEDRARADRVLAWFKFAGRLGGPDEHEFRRYARHVAACHHAGIEPAAPTGRRWTPAARAWIEEEVREAAVIVGHFDDESTLAIEREVSMTVDFQADPKVPRSRRDAARAAAQGAADVVDLRAYRERRP